MQDLKRDAEIYSQLIDYRDNVISGRKVGITTGFDELDKYTGRMDKGQIWAVGGYSGVGKSYFILNMIDRIHRSEDVKVAVFSTELSELAYAKRYAFMRAGMWPRSFENSPEIYKNTVNTIFEKYRDEVLGSNRLRVYSIADYSEIQKALTEDTPDIAFVDYVQEVAVDKKYNPSETMPLLAARFKTLAMALQIPIVIVSQISNASIDPKNQIPGKAPFDYGKELNRTAHVSLWLKREVDDFNRLENRLGVNVVKARDGETGIMYMDILLGYRLKVCKKESSQN